MPLSMTASKTEVNVKINEMPSGGGGPQLKFDLTKAPIERGVPLEEKKIADKLTSLLEEDFCQALARLSRTYHEFKADFDIWHPRMAHINPSWL